MNRTTIGASSAAKILQNPSLPPNPMMDSERPPNTDAIRCKQCGAERYVPGDGRTQLEICPACKAVMADALFKKLCPDIYQETDIARLPRHQYEKVMQWKPGPKGLLLYGPTGKCKTRIVWKLLEKLIKEDFVRGVQVFSATGFGHELNKAYNDESVSAEGLIESIWKAPLVFFDDLGKCKFTERVETELFGVIDYRTSHKLPIIATTNDTGQSLADRVSENRAEPLIRRLREFCEVIAF